ncbi:MAG: DNA repair protein RecO [Alphaproteobacteria bacterium]|nr:DNA repair protein RecO [Alphaproteobacteria bacterium]
MEWLDEGLLLRTQPHGESNLIATFFTHYHGLTTGYIRTNKKYPLQPGNLYHIRNKSRLETQMGLFTVEPHETFAPILCAALISPIKLACMNAIRTLLIRSLIDHDIKEDLYTRLKQHIHEICLNANIGHYVLFEKDLLAYCGFGLDLTRCAVTNAQENLAYVSPRTGRAVTESVGSPYKDQLFHLPAPFAYSNTPWSKPDILDGLKITGHFIRRMLQEHLHRDVPPERGFVITLINKLKES